jgi:hypothetical protein
MNEEEEFLALNRLTHIELLKLIINEIDENGKKYKNNKELFFIIFKNENFERYRSNWSYWLGKQKGKLNKEVRNLIQNNIGFSSDIWDSTTSVQAKTIKEAVREFLNPTATIELNISDLLLNNAPATPPQKTVIEEIKYLGKDETVSLLKNNANFLEKTLENQTFLIELIEPLYNKGLYDFLAKHIFTSILRHNLDVTTIKIIHAHTLGILTKPDYLEATSILNSIISNNLTSDIIDIQTALISNLRRLKLEKDDLTVEELSDILTLLRGEYTNLVEYNTNRHYYPAINLMYILKLTLLITENKHYVMQSDLANLYEDAKKSIKKESFLESKESRYYAQISDIEFQLLLEKNHIRKNLEFILEDIMPLHTWVERTLRQLNFFINIVKKFSNEESSNIIKNTHETIQILEDYMDYKV